jgi:SpoVK/Ycf46/Vps4 family AAA+-type ATPase
MARGDLLKKLFVSYKKRDDDAFYEAANAVIEEEKKKRHVVLATELKKILSRSVSPLNNTTLDIQKDLAPLPKDVDKELPLIDVRVSARRLSSLVLNNDQTKLINNILEEFRDWDVLAAHGLEPIRRVLLYGPPGSGKTAIAHAIAAELEIPLLYVRFESVISSLLGETATNLRKIFDYAEHDRWVLFFDEFDALGRSRSTDQDHGELKRVVNTFLQLLDQFSGQSLVIAATNHQMFLDPAIWRRFDEIVPFNLPSAEEIERLIKILMGSWLTSFPEKTDILNMQGMSYADVERACVNAKKQSVMRGERKVEIESLLKTIEKEKRRMDMISTELQN